MISWKKMMPGFDLIETERDEAGACLSGQWRGFTIEVLTTLAGEPCGGFCYSPDGALVAVSPAGVKNLDEMMALFRAVVLHETARAVESV